MIKRHIDDGIYLGQFKKLGQWVNCPKCQHLGILKYMRCENTTDGTCNPQKYSDLKFACMQCQFVIHKHHHYDFSEHRTIKIYARCPCCGGQWLNAQKRILNSGHPPKTLSATCSLCQKTSAFPTDPRSVQVEYQRPLGITDYGLQLYLQQPTRHGLIFVYNPQHLAELKAFIQANLRERTQNTGNSCYYSRLPAWIKSTRHRKDVLKAITMLEQKIASNPFYFNS